VDDEEGLRDMLADVLQEMGWRAETAATAQEALQEARQQSYDVALLDVRLPDMLGTDLLARLKEIQPDTAAIMLTGYASLQSSIRSLNEGASAYLVKPLNLEALVQTIDQALRRQRSVIEDRRLLDQCRQRIRDLEAREIELSEQIHHLERELASLRPDADRSGMSRAES
jgi:DNA-binding response OmpR family regulator